MGQPRSRPQIERVSTPAPEKEIEANDTVIACREISEGKNKDGRKKGQSELTSSMLQRSEQSVSLLE